MQTARYWESSDEKELLIRLAGFHFGPDPMAAKDQIDANKKWVASELRSRLNINGTSVGFDLGAGFGLLAKHVAAFAKFVHCCDISQSFLKVADKECERVLNLSFHEIQSGDLSVFTNDSMDFGYANNVFIHLDIYEILAYLKEIHRVLKPGGRFYFDLAEIERVDSINNPEFLDSYELRRKDPFHKGCVQHNSLFAVHQIAQQLGFKIESSKPTYDTFTDIILSKA